MIFSNVIAFSIILTTAAVLNANGVTNINSATQAAEALRPLAGNFTFLLFALGIIGTGMLAIPVLAGSAAYGVSEAFGWPATLEAKAPDAVGFYTIIAAATVIGFGLGFTGIDAIHMLVWSAVLNGIVAVPIMAMMMVIVANSTVDGPVQGQILADCAGLDRHRIDGPGGGRLDRLIPGWLNVVPAICRISRYRRRLWAHVCRTGLFAPGVLDMETEHLARIRKAYVWDPQNPYRATTIPCRATSCSMASACG